MEIFPTDLDDDWDWQDPQSKGDFFDMETERETFESGAVRDKTDYRYDLCSPVIFNYTQHEGTRKVIFAILEEKYHDALSLLTVSRPHRISFADIVHSYAQTMHEGANKYGERNWEKGLPESNLKNHAIHHLMKWDSNDQSEPHFPHAVWNIVTLIHFYDQPTK